MLSLVTISALITVNRGINVIQLNLSLLLPIFSFVFNDFIVASPSVLPKSLPNFSVLIINLWLVLGDVCIIVNYTVQLNNYVATNAYLPFVTFANYLHLHCLTNCQVFVLFSVVYSNANDV